MKILIIANMRSNFGGITSQVDLLSKSLSADSFQCRIISTHGKPHKRLISVIETVLTSGKYDLILGVGCAFRGFFPIVISSLVSKLRNIPVCMNFHDGQIRIFLERHKSLAGKVFKDKKVVVASPFLFDEMKANGFNPVLIPNHFDFESFPRPNSNLKKNWVIWSRAFEQLYQPELALKVAARVSDETGYEFHFYGDGSLYDSLRSKFENNGIKFFGLINKIELLEKLPEYKIFFNTTKYDNFPLSLVESAFYGLMIISTPSDGVKSLYSDRHILFSDMNDEEKITQTFVYAVNNFDTFKYLTDNMKEKINEFTWKNVRQKWLKVFNSCLN